MDAKHHRLTADQAERTREGYRRLIRLSKERHAFGRLGRKIGFTANDVKELWAIRVEKEAKP